MTDGLTVTCDIDGKPVDFTLPPPGNSESKFCISLPKAGSTLLYKMMRQLCGEAGLAYYSLQEDARERGILPAQIPAEASNLFRHEGYLYAGFRAIPGKLALPPWASHNTIVLVRDPRDMLVSLYYSQAFSHGAPGRGESQAAYEAFLAKRLDATSHELDAFVRNKIDVTNRQFATIKNKLARVPHRLYRYEDVIFDKEAWLADIVSYLKLAVSEKTIKEIAAKEDERPRAENVQAHVRQVTPGDHKKKLKPETVAALSEAFTEIRSQYRYE